MTRRTSTERVFLGCLHPALCAPANAEARAVPPDKDRALLLAVDLPACFFGTRSARLCKVIVRIYQKTYESIDVHTTRFKSVKVNE